MSGEYQRLKYIVKELISILNTRRVTKGEIKILKDDIINYIKTIDDDIEIEPVFQSEHNTQFGNWKYKYECPECEVEFYREEHNLFGYGCNDCRRRAHEYNRKELFY